MLPVSKRERFAGKHALITGASAAGSWPMSAIQFANPGHVRIRKARSISPSWISRADPHQ